MLSTFISLFCGFLIQPADFASFWLFMYWLDPMHYALEGLVVTQFHLDDTVISLTGTEFTTTASGFVQSFYTDWKYEHRGYAVMALLLFIVFFRYVTRCSCCALLLLCYGRLLVHSRVLLAVLNWCRVMTYLSLEYMRHDKR
jgi:hypothetical protein